MKAAKDRLIYNAVIFSILVIAGCIFCWAMAAWGLSLWESQRSLECINQMKIIAFGLHNYHDTYKHFPPATIAKNLDETPPEKALSWLYAIDPYLHARMDPRWQLKPSQHWDAPEIKSLVDQPHSFLNCPRHGIPSSNHSNYLGISGVGEDAAWLRRSNENAGFFGYQRIIGLKDISGGASNCLAFVDTFRDM